jgi:2-aminomuconate deaminase
MTSENKTLKENAMPLGNYPHVKRIGDFIYISGTSSRRADNTHAGATQDENGVWCLNIAEQTRAVILNIQSILQSVGSDLPDLIDITTFLIDMKDFKAYNEVYSEFFNASTGPTRTTIAVHQLPHPNLLIEIKAIAHFKSDSQYAYAKQIKNSTI